MSWRLGCRWRCPEVVRFDNERGRDPPLYGLDRDATRPFGQQCLAARRMVEQGVRFVQIFHGSNGAPGPGTPTATSALGTLSSAGRSTCRSPA